MTFERVRRSLTFRVSNLDQSIQIKQEEIEAAQTEITRLHHELFEFKEERVEVVEALKALSTNEEEDWG